MRIALLTTQWPGVRLGGIGVYTVNCARALAQAGHEVHVFTFTLPADAVMPPGAVVHQVRSLAEQVMDGRIPGEIAAGLQAENHILAAAELLCRHVMKVDAQVHFDIIEGPEYEALTFPLATVDRPHAAIITQLHSGSAIAREAGSVPLDHVQIQRELVEWAALIGCDGLCGPSQQVFDDTWLATGRPRKVFDDAWLASLDKTAHVIPLPFDVDTAPFTPPPDHGPILYVGRLEHLKGAHLLAQAANTFLRDYPTAYLRIAGPDTLTAPGGGSMANWMRQQITPDLATRVTFLGELTRAQITDELRQCAFVVIPSLRESYSYVCCESLAAGRAVVVADRTGAREVAGDAGVVFENNNAADLARAVGDLCENPELRRSLAEKAWCRARTTLGAKPATEARIAFYRRVLQAPRQDPMVRLRLIPTCYPPLQSLQKIRDILAGKIPPMPPDTLTPGTGYLTPGMRMLHVLDKHGPNIHAYLYGAGRHTTRLLAEKYLWESRGHKIVGLIDDHPRFVDNPTHLGLSVTSCAAASQRLGPADVVILSTDAFEDQFWQQTESLRSKGIPVYRLYG